MSPFLHPSIKLSLHVYKFTFIHHFVGLNISSLTKGKTAIFSHHVASFLFLGNCIKNDPKIDFWWSFDLSKHWAIIVDKFRIETIFFFHLADRLAKKAYANCSSTNMIKPCKIYTSNGDYYLRYVILRSGLSFLHYSNELHNNTV